ncbi:23S rRNA (uridine(2552)-2'-O)-methyltransferase [Halobacteriales archaeon QS_8_69_26]|nr:MAG: 23S rRNA (uridine(2552)-2'-O)-methyltransferase [Halobacteriales archaeon QS_8_69_26]
MTDRDDYYNRAKQEGYRARSAYKLKQLDEAAGLLSRGDTVVDLGAAPDRQSIDPIETDARVDTVRGDLTDEDTLAAIRGVVGERGADLVISDMAPNVSGTYELDHARSVHLARRALAVAEDVLTAGGDLAVKVFQGPDIDDFRDDVEDAFEYARTISPDASRDSSSEVYVVGKGRLTAPVRVGDRLEVDVEDEGSEGDGVATVEGFTLFVPDAEAGETVSVEVTDLKPRYGFAERID